MILVKDCLNFSTRLSFHRNQKIMLSIFVITGNKVYDFASLIIQLMFLDVGLESWLNAQRLSECATFVKDLSSVPVTVSGSSQ